MNKVELIKIMRGLTPVNGLVTSTTGLQYGKAIADWAVAYFDNDVHQIVACVAVATENFAALSELIEKNTGLEDVTKCSMGALFVIAQKPKV